jgi:hypothetical protein
MKIARLLFLTSMAACARAYCADLTAAQQFGNLESLLVRTGRFDVDAHVVSHGAVESDLTTSLGVANDGDVAIHMHGTMDAKPVSMMLRSDGVVTIVTHDGQNQRLQPGRAMRQAVEVGFLRMGLMHNLLLLTQLQQPDHQKGGVDTWVRVDNIHYAAKPRDGQIGLSFNVLIDGKKQGDATLWIDAHTHLPLQREQTLVLDGETVKTVEDYSRFIPTA